MQPEFDVSKLKFEFDLNKCEFKLDRLQERLLQFYLRADTRFRRAFSQNFTNDFLNFIKDKTKLNEPLHISMMGNIRAGKSYSAITICAFHQACYGRKFLIDNICANAFEFLEKLRTMPQEKLKDRIFLIDEEKQTIFGIGSTAKKMKLTDVANIIAINNISTISINPTKWVNPESCMYGLRVWGRDFNYKIVRCMLYNLQERGKGGELPQGNVYLPIFTAFLPKDYAEPLEKEYLNKKNEWVMQEQRAETDVLYEIKKKSAENFCRDSKFLEINKKDEKLAYIGFRLGSEWTHTEILEIYQITKLLQQGILNEE
jgi:hypothetical protein